MKAKNTSSQVSTLRAFFESNGKEESQLAKENATRPKTALGAKDKTLANQFNKADSIERVDHSLTASKPKVEARSGRDNETSDIAGDSGTMDQLLVDIGPTPTDTNVPASNETEQVTESVDDLHLSPTTNIKSASRRTTQHIQSTPELESKQSNESAKPDSPLSTTHTRPPTAWKTSPVARRMSHNLLQEIASPTSVSPPTHRRAESGRSSESGTPAYMRQTSSSISRSSISPTISSPASGSASHPIRSVSSRTSDSRRNLSASSSIKPTSPRADRGSSNSPAASPTANRGSNRALATSSAGQQNTTFESRRSTSHSLASKGVEPSYMRPTQASRSHELAAEKRPKNI